MQTTETERFPRYLGPSVREAGRSLTLNCVEAVADLLCIGGPLFVSHRAAPTVPELAVAQRLPGVTAQLVVKHVLGAGVGGDTMVAAFFNVAVSTDRLRRRNRLIGGVGDLDDDEYSSSVADIVDWTWTLTMTRNPPHWRTSVISKGRRRTPAVQARFRPSAKSLNEMMRAKPY